MNSVSVVIVNFDGERYLPSLFAALDATGVTFHEVIVADDASRDGSRLWLREHRGDVKVLKSPRNRGPSAARNAGLFAAEGDLVLFLDNDGLPKPDALRELLRAFAEDPHLTAAQPRILIDGDPPIVQCDGASCHFTGQMELVSRYVPLPLADKTEKSLDSLMTTACLVHRESAIAAGGFGEDFFMFYEDHDFGVRLRLAGGKLKSVPTAEIRHLGGTKGLSMRVGQSYPARRAYLTARNRWYFLLRTMSARTALVLAPLLLLHELAQLAYSLQRGWIEHWFAAFWWNQRRLGRTLREREVIFARRRVGDGEILHGGPLPLHPGTLNRAGGFTAKALSRFERLLSAGFCCLQKGLARRHAAASQPEGTSPASPQSL